MNLERLDVDDNVLKDLPVEISNLTELYALSISADKFSELEIESIKKLLPNTRIELRYKILE